MAKLQNVIGAGNEADRPAAGAPGAVYCALDTGRLFRDNGATWDSVGRGAGLAVGILIVRDIPDGTAATDITPGPLLQIVDADSAAVAWYGTLTVVLWDDLGPHAGWGPFTYEVVGGSLLIEGLAYPSEAGNYNLLCSADGLSQFGGTTFTVAA